MIGRYRESGGFRSLFRSRDVLRTALAGALAAAGLGADNLLASPPAWVAALPLASLVLTGGPIIAGAARGLARLRSNVDELVSIAIVATLVLGEYNSAAVVAFIMTLGGLIEEYTSDRARRAIESVMRSQPLTALMVEDGVEREAPVSSVEAGSTVRIRPGEVIPLDGTVCRGETCVDESSVTGEPLPGAKAPGDYVLSGTLNAEGCIDVTVSRPARDGTIARIARLIDEAESHRPRVLRVSERYARWFTPVILLLAAATWLATGDPVRAVTVLIVGCPCAFVLATPTAVVAALGAAARMGLMVKGGKFLEAAGEVDQVDFDKTGTLTEAQFEVARVWSAGNLTGDEVVAAAAGAEFGSEHPIGRAIVEEAGKRGIRPPVEITDFAAEKGMGVRAGDVLVGNRRLMEMHGVEIGRSPLDRADAHQGEGMTTLFVALKGAVIGLISIRDRIRPEAPSVIAEIRAMGMRVRLLTGDHAEPARAAAAAAGVDEVRASMLPGDKQIAVRESAGLGRRVAFVGDGANDGPALAEAHVGVSLASRRNNVALETADAVLMDGGLGRLPFLFEIGRRTRRTIMQNLLFFGLAFNAAMISLSALGVLSPVLGALAHNAGSVLVVLNSARLLRLGRVPLGRPGCPADAAARAA